MAFHHEIVYVTSAKHIHHSQQPDYAVIRTRYLHRNIPAKSEEKKTAIFSSMGSNLMPVYVLHHFIVPTGRLLSYHISLLSAKVTNCIDSFIIISVGCRRLCIIQSYTRPWTTHFAVNRYHVNRIDSWRYFFFFLHSRDFFDYLWIV